MVMHVVAPLYSGAVSIRQEFKTCLFYIRCTSTHSLLNGSFLADALFHSTLLSGTAVHLPLASKVYNRNLLLLLNG